MLVDFFSLPALQTNTLDSRGVWNLNVTEIWELDSSMDKLWINIKAMPSLVPAHDLFSNRHILYFRKIQCIPVSFLAGTSQVFLLVFSTAVTATLGVCWWNNRFLILVSSCHLTICSINWLSNNIYALWLNVSSLTRLRVACL